MVRLSRKGINPPKKFTDQVAAKLPKSYASKAAAFEKLPLNGAKRRAGFAAYAPDALPTSKGKPQFPALWGTTKDVIGAMTNGHCAYCQLVVFGGQPGDVEHFRPKSLFPTQAYVVGNYLLGCRTCNQTKSNKWPVGRLTYVRPDAEDPARYFEFLDDGSIQGVKKGKRAEATILDFGLDRAWLKSHRKSEIARALASLKALFSTGLAPSKMCAVARTLLREDLAPMSAAVNQCVLREWNVLNPGTLLR